MDSHPQIDLKCFRSKEGYWVHCPQIDEKDTRARGFLNPVEAKKILGGSKAKPINPHRQRLLAAAKREAAAPKAKAKAKAKSSAAKSKASPKGKAKAKAKTKAKAQAKSKAEPHPAPTIPRDQVPIRYSASKAEFMESSFGCKYRLRIIPPCASRG